MKKIFALLAICLLLCSLFGCAASGTAANEASTPSNPAYETAKEAFDKVDEAYTKTEQFGEDLYEAWRMGIYDKDEVSISYLAKNLSLSEDEIKAAIAGLGYEGFEDLYFTANKDSLFSACVWMVSKAYELNGTVDSITELLNDAKALMKEMSNQYSDYEHYPNLKSYYTTTNAFFEFCQNPTGSFEQVKDTINNYRNEARSYRNDIAYIFED